MALARVTNDSRRPWLALAQQRSSSSVALMQRSAGGGGQGCCARELAEAAPHAAPRLTAPLTCGDVLRRECREVPCAGRTGLTQRDHTEGEFGMDPGRLRQAGQRRRAGPF